MSGAEGSDAQPADKNRLVLPLILVCGLVYFLDGMVHSIMGPPAPDMAATLHLSHAQLGPIFSANLIGQCAGLVIFPMLVGRLGHRRIVLIALVGFGLFEALTAAANSAELLFVARLITGGFLGGRPPPGSAPWRRGPKRGHPRPAVHVVHVDADVARQPHC